MLKNEFQLLLRKASLGAFDFAKQFLKNEMTSNFRYDVTLNGSSDHMENEIFETYSEDDGVVIENLANSQVVDLLFRNNKVPVWIDINVSKSNIEYTTFNLLCAGRYSGDKEALYYHKRGMGPFGIKSPDLPLNLKDGMKYKL